MEIIAAIIVIAVIGLLLGFGLAVADKKLSVEKDEKLVKMEAVMPGANCGGCGYAGCSGLAAAISKGEAPINQCPVGGSGVAAQIGAIMGVEADEGTRMVAFVKCSGNKEASKADYAYNGLMDCNAMKYVPNGGPKSCNYGCLGYGSCVKACPFDAIAIVDGVAVIDKEKCKACGKCVAECPRHIIEMIPYEASTVVSCNSKDFGKDVKAVCSVGCIGCGICQKNCPQGAITVENFLAHVDQSKCDGCGICKEKCPVKIIK